MNFHSGIRIQRGRGIGSVFAGLFRSFIPIAKKGIEIGKKIINSSIVKNIASTALDSGKKAAVNVAADFLEGKNYKKTAQEELEEAKNKIASTIRGRGKNRKRKRGALKKLPKSKIRRKNYYLLN